MLNFSLEITETAREDIRKIHIYIAGKLRNPKAASKLADKIISSSESLSVSPKRYRVRRKDSKGRELRYMPVDNFMIIYSVDDSRHLVKVLHIVYSRRNLENMI